MYGYDLSKFHLLMAIVDQAITGAKMHDCLHTAYNSSIKSARHFLLRSDVYYLSDGGYSRLACRWDGDAEETPRLFLTSESTDKAKANFESINAQICLETLRVFLAEEVKAILG